MINTIIFDFGDVFINPDKPALEKSFRDLGLKEWYDDLDQLNKRFEVGKCSELEFIEGFQKHFTINFIWILFLTFYTIVLIFTIFMAYCFQHSYSWRINDIC